MSKLSLVSTLSISMLVFSAGGYAVQEDEQSANTPEASEAVETNQEAEGQSQSLKSTSRSVLQSNRRTLYFIGPKARSERQLGPAIGAPKSILPTPFVPRGSLQVPEAGEIGALDQGQITSSDAEQPINDDGTAPQDGLADATVNQTSADAQATDGRQDQNISDNTVQQDPFGGVLQERSLERLDPSGVPVSFRSDAESVDTVWEGYSRQHIASFMNELQQPTTLPVLRRLSTAVAASRLILPAPEQESDIIDMINARLAVFAASGNGTAYAALLNALPADRDWSALAQHQARAHLLKGVLSDACIVAENQRAVDVSAYWVRLEAFCMAAAGDRAGVDFQLGILEETRSLDATFYQLLDQILIEAERPAGSVIPEPSVLSAPLQVDVVSATMARLARVQVNDVDTSSIDILAVPMLLQNPSLSQSAQITLLDILLSRGIADAQSIVAAAQNFEIDPVVLQLALSEPSVTDADNGPPADDSASENVTGVLSGGESVDAEAEDDQAINPALKKTLMQMTLLAAVAQESDVVLRNQALEKLWRMGMLDGNIAALAPAIATLTASWPQDSIDADSLGRVVRVSVLSDAADASKDRLRALRVSAAGEDAAKDAALLRLWPLIAINEADSFNPLDFERWWRATDGDSKYMVANTLLTIFSGLGFDVPDRSWALLEGGPVVFEGVNIAPAFWRSMQNSVQANDPVSTLGSVYDLFGDVQAKTVPPSIVGVLMQSMSAAGFRETAKTIAADILISQGL